MKWKILVRRLGSDMNDDCHKKTIDVWKAKFVVQVVMPNDHLKQDQYGQKKEVMPTDFSKQDKYDQKKELKRCDHTDANKEDQVQIIDDDETKVITSTNDHLKEDLKSNQCDPLEQEQHVQSKRIHYSMKTFYGKA